MERGRGGKESRAEKEKGRSQNEVKSAEKGKKKFL